MDPAEALLRFEAELAGAKSAAEAGFIAVNRLSAIMPFRLAVLMQPDMVHKVRVAAVSNLSSVEENAPFTLWLTRIVRYAGEQDVAALTASDLPRSLARDWAEWLPKHAVLCRLTSPSTEVVG